MTHIETEPHRSQAPAAGGASGWATILGLGLLGLGLFANAPAVGRTQVSTGTVPLSTPAYGDSDANRDLIAVTGPDQTGGSVLWVIDTKSRQLAVYQASGGSDSQVGLRFIGGRRIDLDLQVLGYNDRSKESYGDLEQAFLKREAAVEEAEPDRPSR